LLTLTDGRNKVTTWTYDIEGLVRTKKYSGQTFANIEYSYDLNQRLAWRKFWSDAVTSKQTIYSYDDAGNLLGINYPTSPDVTFTYNEVNKVQTMATVGLGTTTFTYTDAENPAAEYGLWTSDGVTNVYHASAPGLRTGLAIAQPASYWSQTYGYDAAQRLTNVVSPAGTFAYKYKGPGTVWTNLGLPNTCAITNGFDTGGRLTGTYLKTSGGIITNKHVYLYNGAGQRQRHTLTDNSYTTYSYDDDGQLATSLGYTSGGTPVSSEQLGFGYDPGWNMTNRSVNGVSSAYTVNDLNEVTVAAGAAMSYDANGNRMTNYSNQMTYTYDDENRLIGMNYPGYWTAQFGYDGLGRLRWRIDGGVQTRYLYDGMRVVQERTAGNVPTVTYTRGKDLSGSLEGAGGIGGLLARTHGYSAGTWSTHNFYHADGGGNVTFMIDAAQTLAAKYKYDPYGRTLSSSGPLATANLYRFSSKEIHANSATYYYGYRFYDPFTQRWISRDPIGEAGFEKLRARSLFTLDEGANVYAFVKNFPMGLIDPLGLSPCTDMCDQDFKNAKDKCPCYARIGGKIGAAAGGATFGLIGAKGGISGLIGGAIIGVASGYLGGWASTEAGCLAIAGTAWAGCQLGCQSVDNPYPPVQGPIYGTIPTR
jgi:RHS repeat-associated protein